MKSGISSSLLALIQNFNIRMAALEQYPPRRNNQKTGHRSFRTRSQRKRRIHARQQLSRSGRR